MVANWKIALKDFPRDVEAVRETSEKEVNAFVQLTREVSQKVEALEAKKLVESKGDGTNIKKYLINETTRCSRLSYQLRTKL